MLGGLTAIRLAATHPDLVRRLVVVDVTPGVNAAKAAPITAFVAGPETFASFDELLARPHRQVQPVPVGQLAAPRAAAQRPAPAGWPLGLALRPPAPARRRARLRPPWADLSAVTVPVMLVCGAESGVVSDQDQAEFASRQPAARLEMVDAAGHSIQGDRPLELAALIRGLQHRAPLKVSESGVRAKNSI